MFDFVYDNCDVENTIEIDVPKIDFGDSIKLVSPVEWEEHCLECSAPLCYESCHMFEKGKYNLCKRTEYGIKRLSNIKYGLYKEPILLSYKRWGKLHAKYYQNVVLTKRKYCKIEKKSFENRGAEYLPRCSKIMKQYIEKKLKWTNRIMRPFIFVFSLGNKKVETMSFCDGLAFSIASTSKEVEVLDLDYMRKGNSITKRQLIIKPGTINNFLISFDEMPGEFDSWDLYPNNWKEKIDFCFFCADIVKMKKGTSILFENDSIKAYEKIKCVVWDLDNTVWKGIIGEAGSDKILIREEIVDIIKQLDERGIISCICSKNEESIANEGLDRFGINELFVIKEINWNPKSDNIRKIAEKLNLSVNNFAFVDDSAIERKEIETIYPSIRTYDELEALTFLKRTEFEGNITSDSKNRRYYYKQELLRKKLEEENKESYETFIRNSDFVVTIRTPYSLDDMNRCIELFERTHQLNCSGRKITREEIEEDRKSDKKVVIFDCVDKYGSYGIVGCLMIIRKDDFIEVSDFVMSCRVAGKKIEAAIILAMCEHFSVEKLRLTYVETERNIVLKNELIHIGGTYREGFFYFEKDQIKESDWINVCDRL